MHWLYINATADVVFMCLAVCCLIFGVLFCRSLWRMERHLSQLKEAFWHEHRELLRSERAENHFADKKIL